MDSKEFSITSANMVAKFKALIFKDFQGQEITQILCTQAVVLMSLKKDAIVAINYISK